MVYIFPVVSAVIVEYRAVILQNDEKEFKY
jgi:hypothetical protein